MATSAAAARSPESWKPQQREGGGSWLRHRTGSRCRRRRRRRRGPTANARSTRGPRSRSSISTRVKRLDGPDKVAGRAKYSFDINRPGMIFGKIVRSPHPHARIVAWTCPRRGARPA